MKINVVKREFPTWRKDGGILLKAVQSFYLDSRACVRVEWMRVSGFWLMLDCNKVV